MFRVCETFPMKAVGRPIEHERQNWKHVIAAAIQISSVTIGENRTEFSSANSILETRLYGHICTIGPFGQQVQLLGVLAYIVQPPQTPASPGLQYGGSSVSGSGQTEWSFICFFGIRFNWVKVAQVTWITRPVTDTYTQTCFKWRIFVRRKNQKKL